MFPQAPIERAARSLVTSPPGAANSGIMPPPQHRERFPGAPAGRHEKAPAWAGAWDF
jgi:hypothetical protein